MNELKKYLYIIGVPIGNIYDFSQRAIFILKNVNIIATEDSRKSGLILNYLNINNKIISLNKYNEISISKNIIEKIKKKLSVALISDAGTPLINDPGFYLIELAFKNNIKVIPIPGISSITTALSISSIKIKNFIFNGFIPKKLIQKKSKIKEVKYEKKILMFFETSERLINTIIIMQKTIQQNRKILILKDLTKNFERYILFENLNLKSIIKNIYKFKKGEIIILINGKNIKKEKNIKKGYKNINYKINYYYKNIF